MSDRPTPETDYLAISCYIDSVIEGVFALRAVPIEDCRKLERERDEAREEINSIRITLSKNGEAVGSVEHDFSIIEMVENLMQSRGYFRRKSDSLERERDEAREVAKILVDYARYYLEELKSRRHPYYQQEIESVSKNIDRVNWREGAK